MIKNTSTDQRKICDATLKMATEVSWASLTLEQIAKKAKIPSLRVKNLYPSTADILPALILRFDNQVIESIKKPKRSISFHDRIFDVIMTRFDLLQRHRIAILNIISETKHNPSLARLILPAQWRAMSSMLSIAGLSADKAKQPFAIAGLLGIYGLTLYAWERDHSQDMAKTMATLDRLLRYGGKLTEILLRNNKC